MDDPIAWAEAQPGDALRRGVLQALARRAAAQPPGPLRDALVARLQRRAAVAPPPLPPRPPPHAPGALAGLLARLPADAGAELRQVRAHEGTWTGLRMARRLAQVAAPVPEHLGPLNSQVLVARALQQLQALSPAYLQRLLTQLDGLAGLAPPPAAESAARPARKPAARRR